MVIGGEKERDPMRLAWIEKGSVGEEYYHCNADGNLEYKDSWGWGVLRNGAKKYLNLRF